MIGSTANIVALGMLEKRYRTHIHFIEWLKVGLIVGILSCLIAWGGIALLSPYMPTVKQRQMHRQVLPDQKHEQPNIIEKVSTE